MPPIFRRLSACFALALMAGTMTMLGASPASAATGTATQISAGGYSSCAITPSKRLKCWGDNTYGQLGIGSDLSPQLKPVLVPNLSNVVQVSVGDYNTCAILQGGKLKCWGYNYYGEVGDGTNSSDRHRPTQVNGLTSRVVGVSVGEYHTCARLMSGKLKCWGYNNFGQIGNGTSGNEYHHPVTVSGIKSATQVSAGHDYTCATVKGHAKCWGYNENGKLGDSSTNNRRKPTQVTGLSSGVKRVSAGYYTTCALLQGGKLKCWGDNPFGEVGNGTTGGDYHHPVQVVGMTSGVSSVDTDIYLTCAVKNEHAKCWGDNTYYQFGDGTVNPSDTPTQVSGLTKNVKQIDIGGGGGCALLQSGTEKCWGENFNGEVGNNSTSTLIKTPKRVLL